jgi:hypothetical protein
VRCSLFVCVPESVFSEVLNFDRMNVTLGFI